MIGRLAWPGESLPGAYHVLSTTTGYLTYCGILHVLLHLLALMGYWIAGYAGTKPLEELEP